MNAEIKEEKKKHISIQTIAVIIAMVAIVVCSTAAIMNHNALVTANDRLDKVISERDDLKAKLASSVAEVETLRKQKSKPAAAKPSTKSTPQLVCGKPGTIAQRLNNPFNIKRQVSGKKWKGEIGYDSQGHVHFISVEYGIRAAALTLKSYYKKHELSTLEAIIKRFCGGNEDYVKFLAHRLKLKPNEEFNVLKRLPELMHAMSKYESGRYLPDECLVTLDIVREF